MAGLKQYFHLLLCSVFYRWASELGRDKAAVSWCLNILFWLSKMSFKGTKWRYVFWMTWGCLGACSFKRRCLACWLYESFQWDRRSERERQTEESVVKCWSTFELTLKPPHKVLNASLKAWIPTTGKSAIRARGLKLLEGQLWKVFTIISHVGKKKKTFSV